MKKFSRKRILITGGGSGLGRALALEFAARGWKIGIAEIRAERAEASVDLIGKAGGHGLAIPCDVTIPDNLQSAAERMRDAWDGVDIIVNNAGVAAAGYMEKIAHEKWEWIMATNLKGVIYGCRVFIPILKQQAGGHIVNVASCAGIASFPEMSCYNVTKAGVISLSETLKVELAPFKIGVSVLAPTFFQTNLMDQFYSPDQRQRNMANRLFEKSTCTAADVARHTYRAVKHNRLYVLPQADAKLVWLIKRMAPELYFKGLAWGYRLGLADRFLR
jgi:NAD(P)-dependent dehydrogenase (short-subunit alcohol dehydrogenase family)